MSNVLKEDIVSLVSRKLLVYGAEVVEQRAVPDYRDGLKPVHRYILWACYGLNLHHNRAFKKAARTVGETIGKFSPHGDASTYDAMVGLAGTKSDDGKDWVTRNIPVPLIEGYGNWGDNIDSAAAMRYTEARLSEFADKYLLDPVYLAVSDYHLNFSGDENVPLVLPAKVPMLLVNGSKSIAFGVAAETPSFHMKGVVGLAVECLMGRQVTPKACLKLEFNPTFGGICVSDDAELLEFYKTGKGSVAFVPQIESNYKDKVVAIVSACPELVSRTSFETLIGKLSTLEGVRSVYDATNKVSLRVEVLAQRNMSEDAFKGLENKVWDMCTRKASFDIGVTIRQADKVSFKRMTVPELIRDWCKWRVELETKVIKHLIKDEERKLARQELLKLAAVNLQAVFDALRSKDSEAYLVRKLKITAEQANEIMSLQVRQLKSLAIPVIEKEIKQLAAKISSLQKDLKAPQNRVIADLKAIDFDSHTY